MFDEKTKANNEKAVAEIDAAASLQKALLHLDPEARMRVLRAAAGYFDIQLAPAKPKATRVRAPKVTA